MALSGADLLRRYLISHRARMGEYFREALAAYDRCAVDLRTDLAHILVAASTVGKIADVLAALQKQGTTKETLTAICGEILHLDPSAIIYVG
jgi:hypothetical protein